MKGNLQWLIDQDAGRRVLRLALVAAIVLVCIAPLAGCGAWRVDLQGLEGLVVERKPSGWLSSSLPLPPSTPPESASQPLPLRDGPSSDEPEVK